jgi:peptide deformylase
MLTLLPDTDPILHKVAEPVTEFDMELWNLCKSMHQTMVANDGIGLAAPQVGISKRIIVVGFSRLELAYINPQIVDASGKKISTEGCLSFPGLFLSVQRATSVVVKFQDVEGVWKELEANGMHAVVLQHEIDHLNGIVFTERVKPMELALARKKLNEKRR